MSTPYTTSLYLANMLSCFRICRNVFYSVLLLSTLVSNSLQAQLNPDVDEGDSTEHEKPIVKILKKEPDILAFSLAYLPAPGEGSFLTEYQKLGSHLNRFEGYASLSMGLRLVFTQELHWNASLGFMSPGFLDLYDVYGSPPANGGDSIKGPFLGSVVEKFSIKGVPLLLGMDYTPIRTQFTTYIGAQAGLGISHVNWTSDVRRQPLSDFQRPGINVKSLGFSPVIRVFGGSDLRFDKVLTEQSGVIRGIFFEASYLYFPVNRSYFSAIRSQSRGLTVKPEEEASMNIGGFVVSLGITLQLIRR